MKSPCLEPGCGSFASFRGRCGAHSTQRDASTNRAGKKVYSTKKWAMTRRRKLTQDPMCEHKDCRDLASVVHHIIDIAEGGDQYAMSNLMSLCAQHHNRETRARQLA